MDWSGEKNISTGSLVRLKVHGAPPYLGIVTERIWHNNNSKMGYSIYLMDLEATIMMFEHEFEVLNESETSA